LSRFAERNIEHRDISVLLQRFEIVDVLLDQPAAVGRCCFDRLLCVLTPSIEEEQAYHAVRSGGQDLLLELARKDELSQLLRLL